MRDAIEMSIQHLKKAHRDKKVLVVITDGNDNSSILSLEHIMKSAHQSDVLIYGVGLLTEEEHREAGRAPGARSTISPRPPAARPSSPRMSRRWMPSRTRWRTISAASTPSNTRPRIRRWTTPSGRSASPPRRRATPPCARAAATTPPRTRRPTSAKVMIRTLWRLSRGYRLLPVAEPLPALAHRDLLGNARGRDHIRPILELRLAPAARTAALPALGRAHALGLRKPAR